MFSLEYAEVTRTASAHVPRPAGQLPVVHDAVRHARARRGSAWRAIRASRCRRRGRTTASRHREPREHGRAHGRRRGDDRRLQHSPVSRRPAQPPRQRLLRARAFYTNLGAEAMLRSDYYGEPRLLARGRGRASRHRGHLGQSWACCTRAMATTSTRKPRICARSRSTTTSRRRSRISRSSTTRSARRELAAEYRERVQGYRERNPYYHFALATRAYEQQQFADALASVRKALRLKPDEHEFYTLRGEVQTALGKHARGVAQLRARARVRGSRGVRAQSSHRVRGLALR